MRKITVPTKADRADPPRDSGQGEVAPRPRLGLKYGANPEVRDRP